MLCCLLHQQAQREFREQPSDCNLIAFKNSGMDSAPHSPSGVQTADTHSVERDAAFPLSSLSSGCSLSLMEPKTPAGHRTLANKLGESPESGSSPSELLADSSPDSSQTVTKTGSPSRPPLGEGSTLRLTAQTTADDADTCSEDSGSRSSSQSLDRSKFHTSLASRTATDTVKTEVDGENGGSESESNKGSALHIGDKGGSDEDHEPDKPSKFTMVIIVIVLVQVLVAPVHVSMKFAGSVWFQHRSRSETTAADSALCFSMDPFVPQPVFGPRIGKCIASPLEFAATLGPLLDNTTFILTLTKGLVSVGDHNRIHTPPGLGYLSSGSPSAPPISSQDTLSSAIDSAIAHFQQLSISKEGGLLYAVRAPVDFVAEFLRPIQQMVLVRLIDQTRDGSVSVEDVWALEFLDWVEERMLGGEVRKAENAERGIVV